MNKLLPKFFFVFFLMISSPFLWSQERLEIDTDPIIKKEFGSPLKEKYTDRVFDYSENTSEAGNILFRFLSWILRGIGDTFGFEVSYELFKTIELIFYGLLIALASYLLIRFLSNHNFTSVLTKKTKNVDSLSYDIEDIKNVDFDLLISEALKTKDYRLAIRYMYLKSLKLLSVRNFIQWDIQKTNNDYSAELKNTNLKALFRKISFWYDHIWYGEYALDSENFERAKADFVKLDQETKHV